MQWKARKMGKAYRTPAAAPTLEFSTLQLMTERKRVLIDKLNKETRWYLDRSRYTSELQPEYPNQISSILLGRQFIACGNELPDDSNYGKTLIKAGEALTHVGEVQLAHERDLREGFLRHLIRVNDEEIHHYDVCVLDIDLHWITCFCHSTSFASWTTFATTLRSPRRGSLASTTTWTLRPR